MESGSDGEALHVVMFPWLAMGHLIPFLHLSKHLAQRGHKVSFISTPRNLSRLPKIPPNLSHLIDFVSIPLPKVPSLPDPAESSMDIHHSQAQLLKIAFDQLESPLATFLETSTPRPDWILYDYASHWLPPLARKFQILTSFFSLFNAACMAFIGPPALILTGEVVRSRAEDFAVVPKWIPFQSSVCYRVHEMMKYIDGSAGKNESGTPDTIRFPMSVDGCDVVVFRTSIEFEEEYFSLVCQLYQKPVIPVGFLPPQPAFDDVDDDENGNETWLRIKDWLDKHRDNSVVYVALGTEATLSRQELTEMALGLEQSGLPFFWVLRKPPGSSEEVCVSDMLPEGYEERVAKTCGGMVCKQGWLPQVKILSHPAIGGCLTHCGWNSIIEALSFGHVLILFPVMNDQGLNARLLQEKKIGVEIPRDEKDGTFTSRSVAEVVRLVMVSDEGESVRAKARDMRALFGDQAKSASHVDSLVRYLADQRRQHPSSLMI